MYGECMYTIERHKAGPLVYWVVCLDGQGITQFTDEISAILHIDWLRHKAAGTVTGPSK